MKRSLAVTTVVAAVALVVPFAMPAGATSTQSDAAFAGSYAANGVTNVSATTQRISCYSPEVLYFEHLDPNDGYVDGGMSPCGGAATTDENTGPYATQDVSNPAMLVKDRSESDIRVDPTDARHLIGQSKWFVSGEGYNHLLGFYESFDGGLTWPVQGHVPGYEGWTNNTDPVGAFDPWGNFYSLVLPYQFYYDKAGFHKYANGSRQTNPGVPAEAVAVAVHPAETLAGTTAAASWITTHNGQPDYLMTARNAATNDPDKQWITIDSNPSSPHYGRVYAMWTLYVYNPGILYEAHADARPDGTHTDWSAPQVLPTVPGKRFDTFLLPHVAPDGTVWTTTTLNPVAHGYKYSDINLIRSSDGGATWQGPLPVARDVIAPTYQNTTFREGIVNTFAVGPTITAGGNYPLYTAYEDGSSGLSNIYLIASYDAGRSWTSPIRVNDNVGLVDELQPNLGVAPNGTVSVAFYDRRLPCPTASSTEAAGSGVAYDPGTSASPGTPWGRSNYCVNTAIQFYDSSLTPIGLNVRVSAHTWDPQLSAPHPSCFCSPGTFIGDYFGVDSGGGFTYTTSVSTFDQAGENPSFHQQQIVATIATP